MISKPPHKHCPETNDHTIHCVTFTQHLLYIILRMSVSVLPQNVPPFHNMHVSLKKKKLIQHALFRFYNGIEYNHQESWPRRGRLTWGCSSCRLLSPLSTILLRVLTQTLAQTIDLVDKVTSLHCCKAPNAANVLPRTKLVAKRE